MAAVELVDRAGLGALTMRRLGASLGVEAMSVYKHVANKDDILDGMVELVIGQIETPSHVTDWKEAMRRRAASAREVLGVHSWAIGLIESRGATGSVALGYLNAVVGILRSAGFSIDQAAHAFWLLDSFVYGHVVQETSMPVSTPEEITESTKAMLARITPEEYPHLVELGQQAMRSSFSFDGEFGYGLDLILDALERDVFGSTSH